MSGDRWNPTSPKANPHWAAMYAAKRRALDRALLASMERELAEMEKPRQTDEERARIARAFGRPSP